MRKADRAIFVVSLGQLFYGFNVFSCLLEPDLFSKGITGIHKRVKCMCKCHKAFVFGCANKLLYKLFAVCGCATALKFLVGHFEIPSLYDDFTEPLSRGPCVFLWSKYIGDFRKVKQKTGYIEIYRRGCGGADCGFGGFCKGSWEKSFLLLNLMMLTSKINTFMIEFVQFIHCG